MAEERKTSLTKRDVNRVIARWYITTEMSLNYERMQSIAYTYALIPALKKLYPNKEDMIPALQRHLMGRKPYLMGGIDAGIVDNPFATEEEVRQEVQRAIHDSEGLPGFIPCITYGLPESIRPGIFEMISEEIEKYNQSKK